ncbi:hypothetical protein GU334_11395 [Lactococcus raffinolactis]|jgi:hypothetical protein|uniref:Uncharacterized protein n=1 Tax=Pseudolactococcus raffinolactis TaxID=1366 RepID=A0AAE6YNX4_9LACT|nr:hypothetical protein [Lactococcus raffinolactis]QIW59470.1 hypothetical protein GU334_11395 [Lactococcus raffinolactis]
MDNKLEFSQSKSKNGIDYHNNNDVTKTIRVKTEDWRVFSTLSLFENKTRSDMFGILLSTYLEHTEGLSEEQRTLILSEIEKF